jgi:hypothetical protein
VYDHLELSAIDAAKLVAAGPLGPDSWVGIDPTEIEYGTSWETLIDHASNMNDLIEAAAVAGRIGFCDSGIPLALRAAQLDVVAEAAKALASGATGEALLWLDAAPFREFAAMALEIVADLEERAAVVHGEDLNGSMTRDVRRLLTRKKQAAVERAAKARKRSRLVRRDTTDHENEGAWWDEVRVLGQS